MAALISLLFALDITLLFLFVKNRNRALRYLLILIGLGLVYIYGYLLHWELTVNSEFPSILALPFALFGIFHLLMSFGILFRQKL